MSIEHKVKQGECISSIADKYGFHTDTIWNDPGNSSLKEKRKKLNVLNPGDIVIIPEKQLREKSIDTEQLHWFRKKVGRVHLKIKLLDEEGNPRSNISYILKVEELLKQDKTDAEGFVKAFIVPGAKDGTLTLDLGKHREEYKLNLGSLDQLDIPTGIQKRLLNLGYDCGPPDGDIGDRTKEAIKSFQREKGLESTGELDEQTKKKLEEDHLI